MENIDKKYIERLKELKKSDDPEYAHKEADNILSELLVELGYKDIVKNYDKIYKWYA